VAVKNSTLALTVLNSIFGTTLRTPCVRLDSRRPDALAAFLDETRRMSIADVRLIELDAHINDEAFAAAALRVLDAWVGQGWVAKGVF
jgi:hypothetical protein